MYGQNNYQNNGYQNNGYRNNGYQNNGYQNNGYQPQPKKHSGCKMTVYTPEKGKNAGQKMFVMNGWRKTKYGFFVIKCNPTNKSKAVAKGYLNSIACEVVNRSTGETNLHWGIFHIETKKVRIPDLGLVLNPNAPNGGYCGISKRPQR